MIIAHSKNAIHKQWMLRLLSEIADNTDLSRHTAFKGGSCAALLGYLDRFSVDLDFDLISNSNVPKLRKQLHTIFEGLDLSVDDESRTQLQFFLKYKSRPNERNTLKLEIIHTGVQENKYEKMYIPDIDRYVLCQNIETIFANKLVAPVDRYEQHGTIAGRDIYDINFFFNQEQTFRHQVIEERRNTTVAEYFSQLQNFIKKNITQKIIHEDLNYLLPPKSFQLARKTLKTEVLANLNTAILNLEEST